MFKRYLFYTRNIYPIRYNVNDYVYLIRRSNKINFKSAILLWAGVTPKALMRGVVQRPPHENGHP